VIQFLFLFGWFLLNLSDILFQVVNLGLMIDFLRLNDGMIYFVYYSLTFETGGWLNLSEILQSADLEFL